VEHRQAVPDVGAILQADVEGYVEVGVAVCYLHDPVSCQIASNGLSHIIGPDAVVGHGWREMRCCCLNWKVLSVCNGYDFVTSECAASAELLPARIASASADAVIVLGVFLTTS
jgi:hypothetical protein